MNWLAHLYLSEASPGFRIGNLLPDLVAASELKGLPADFLRGADCHRRIDSFTDAHPIVLRSKGRISAARRRYSGILMDVFYDHFLARDWMRYSNVPLECFAREIYDAIAKQREEIPAAARARLEGMNTYNWLCSYRELDGVRQALDRIGGRLRKPVNLGGAVAELETQYDALHGDFEEFFPELAAHVGRTHEIT